MTKTGRLARVSAAAFLIWFIAIGINSTNDEMNFGYAFAAVLSFWVVTSLIQIVLCVRFSERRDGSQSFRIGTILLIMSYIAVYLVPIRLAVQSILATDSNLEWSHWIVIGVTILGISVIVSIVQLVVAEALITTLVAIQKNWRSVRR